jgi:hypothetical protein
MKSIILKVTEAGVGVEPSPALAGEIAQICASALTSKLKGSYKVSVNGIVRKGEEKKKADPVPTPEEPSAEAESTKRRRSKKR